ncbi:23S ribosomal RNA methyltransferase Erm [Paractinoplanes rishiriensis]|uniref:23S rRNA (Adenine(2058)-N(6))-methyltransferase Erm(O) n=1 Tax=Paractinoplanes rishiriensis TaxID=1050105 RepID=A0A919K360_9ACTN|nr:23S ribosomal RNA methyltransferase Erm [Actinoplanes rishiriensis]GIE98654.1 23S rRNA (adenine(2058)-N(6))-methyltransferase Erm(O) [Actinoplanes rishiriensis]
MAPLRSHARTRRAFGQNFLADPAAARLIAEVADPGHDTLLYEVGAGRGRLTTELLRRSSRVVAYEIDPEMAARLPRDPRLSVRTADFLAARPPRSEFEVAGNIPYALTAGVVRWCLTADSLRRATLLTQWEYARKRSGDYGRWSRLTVLTWPEFSWRLAGRVPRAAFRPVPRVDGGILQLDRRAVPLVAPDRLPAWRRLVEDGFTGTGGSLPATLARRYGTGRAAGACRAARIGPDTPVGEVWPEQWLTLFQLLDVRSRRATR